MKNLLYYKFHCKQKVFSINLPSYHSKGKATYENDNYKSHRTKKKITAA